MKYICSMETVQQNGRFTLFSSKFISIYSILYAYRPLLLFNSPIDAYEPGDIRWRYLFFSIKNLDAYEPGDTRWRHTELWTMYIHRIHSYIEFYSGNIDPSCRNVPQYFKLNPILYRWKIKSISHSNNLLCIYITIQVTNLYMQL